MSDSGASINLSADALEYVEQKFLKLFGKDSESVQLTSWFKGLQETALAQTATVHCLGMRNPLPFDSIYQPTRLIVGPDEGEMVPSESAYVWGDRVRYRCQEISRIEELLVKRRIALEWTRLDQSGQ